MRPSISLIFSDFLRDHPQDHITFGELIRALGHRGQAMLLLLLALPNAFLLSSIPGMSTLFGIPMCFISLQMLMSLPALWVPAALESKKIDRVTLERIIKFTIPYLVKIERFIRPRFVNFTYGFFEKLIALSLLVQSIIIALPLPFGNVLGGWGVVILSMSIIERDGILALIGKVYTVVIITALYFLADKILTFIFSLIS